MVGMSNEARRRRNKRETARMADPVNGLGREGRAFNRETDEPILRRGATRPRITVGREWAEVLTERQMTASGRRYRARTSRAWGRMLQQMKSANMSMAEFVEGLSNEELARGQLLADDGTFNGRPPVWVPREFHQACLRELMRRGKQLWKENYVQAIQTMTQIANDKRVKASDRIKAATFVIERLEGKVPERLEVALEDPWQAIITDIIAEVSDAQVGRARKALAGAVHDDVMDAEVVDAPPPVPRSRRTARRRQGE